MRVNKVQKARAKLAHLMHKNALTNAQIRAQVHTPYVLKIKEMQGKINHQREHITNLEDDLHNIEALCAYWVREAEELRETNKFTRKSNLRLGDTLRQLEHQITYLKEVRHGLYCDIAERERLLDRARRVHNRMLVLTAVLGTTLLTACLYAFA